jgi:hypothetical protein
VDDSPHNESARPSPKLLTEEEVLAHLREETSRSTQVEVAKKYDISPSQLNDILHGRGGLSKMVLAKLRWRMIKLYQKLED